MGEEGFELTLESRTKSTIFKSTGSKSGNIAALSAHARAAKGDASGATLKPKQSPAHGAPNARAESPAVPPTDAELARLIAAWPTLAAPLRAAVLAIVNSAQQ
jgi:hypothetical protein